MLCTLQEVQLPDGITSDNVKCINANGYLAWIGTPSTNATAATSQTMMNRSMVAAAASPSSPTPGISPRVRFEDQSSTFAAGFDGMSTPPWLMVPVGGTNSCLAYTGATSTSSVAFAVIGGNETVSPTTTTNNPETITVTGANIGSSSHVNYGVGSSPICSGTGLGISVKAKQIFTIAYHVITQQSGTTTIAPTNAPSASDLQNYLNQVFGVQTNTFFEVTRTDLSGNYDYWVKNGKLDIAWDDKNLSDEEKVIDTCKDTTKKFNIYYVHDFICAKVSSFGEAAGR